jgi:hypothetical protein
MIAGCTINVKNAVIAWWAFETRVSLNKADVMRNHLEVGVYDDKPTHFLMETQVMCTSILSFIMF